MSTRIKHILSISLGSSSRDKTVEIKVLGQRLLLDRRGTDGDMQRFESFLLQHDGAVEVLCVGGSNLGLRCGDRFYPYRTMDRLLQQVKHTPVVDGSGIKATLEPLTLEHLQEQHLVDFSASRVLLSSSLDRFGMAEYLDQSGAEVIYGEFMFGLGWPLPLCSLKQAQRWGQAILPLFTRLPMESWWAGNRTRPHTARWDKYFRWADVLAGDFPTLRRHMPADLAGKVVITNSTTEEDERLLTQRGVRLLVTTSPTLEGRVFATNVLEGVFTALLDKPPGAIRAQDYVDLAGELGWKPNVQQLA